jgi:hypothetical protein
MSLWTTTRFYVPFRRARYSTHTYRPNSLPVPFLSPIAITSVVRTAGLLVQPSPDAPSGWLVLSALFGLPITLWAYKVRPSFGVDVSEMVDFPSPVNSA